MALGFSSVSDGLREVKTVLFWRDCICEFMVSFMLIYGAQGNATPVTVGGSIELMYIAINNGMTVFVLIELFGHLSGAHMNPAVSWFFCLTKNISIVKAVFFSVCQAGGAAAGAGTVYLLMNEAGRNNMSPISLTEGVSVLQGILCEMLISLQLCLVIAGSTDAKRRKVFMASMPIGFAVVVGILAGGKITGGAMNPLIPFGPAAVKGIFPDHICYWAGPFAGATLAAIAYNSFTALERLSKKPTEETENNNNSDMKIEMNGGETGNSGTI